MKTLLLFIGILFLNTGCNTLVDKVEKLDALNITHLELETAATSTKLTERTENEKVISRFEHYGFWLRKGIIERDVTDKRRKGIEP
jgi:hypothetical protein